MLAQVTSCAVVGLEGALVQVEVDVSNGGPYFSIVGLPDAAVQEARERVRSAIRNSGAHFPYNQRLTVNLAPADLRKEGPAYDLPMALALVMASGGADSDLDGAMVVGELSLDGSVRHTNGILPMVSVARQRGLKRVYVPARDAAEAALVEGLEVYPVPNLAAMLDHLNGASRLARFEMPPMPKDEEVVYPVDMADVKGQEHVKRAVEVAAAGAHNVLMTGPPGAGKTLISRAVPSILPPMAIEEALDVTKVYSVSGLLPADTPLILRRPFRSPHHTISHAGLVGGGHWPRPGEISLAHRGVLFLDELPEFGARVLEVLRQPLEDKVVTISRAAGTLTFPANFVLTKYATNDTVLYPRLRSTHGRPAGAGGVETSLRGHCPRRHFYGRHNRRPGDHPRPAVPELATRFYFRNCSPAGIIEPQRAQRFLFSAAQFGFYIFSFALLAVENSFPCERLPISFPAAAGGR